MRIKALDTLRVMAAVAVTLIHASGYLAADYRFAFWLNQAARFAVPMFILLSGLVMALSDARKETFSVSDFYRRRATRILIPYVLWTVLYNAYYHQVRGDAFSPATVLRDLRSGFGAYHLYFILIIFQLYLLYPLLRAAFRRAPGVSLAVCSLLTLYYQSAEWLTGNPFHLDPPQPHVLLAGPFFFPTWIGFFALGMALAPRLEAMAIRVTLPRTILLMTAMAAALFLLGREGRLYNTLGSSDKPTVILYTLTAFGALFSLAVLTSGRIPLLDRLMGTLARQSFLIYFFHVMVQSRLSLWLEARNYPLAYSNRGFLMIWAGVLLVTGATALLADRLPWPWLSWLGATPAAKKKPGAAAG